MDELTTVTHGPAGYTVVTGWDATLAENATRREALTALFHRGFTPVVAVEAVNAAVRIGHFAVAGLPAD